MGKDSPSTPPPPDPRQMAQNQMQANTGTARVQQRLNMIDENTPWYTTKYTGLGDRSRNADGSPKNPPIAAGDPNPNNPSTRGANPNVMSQERWDSMDPSFKAMYPELDPGGSSSGGGGGGNASGNDEGSLDGEPAYWNQDRYSRDITLNPDDQKILDQQRRLTQGLGGLAEGQIPRLGQSLSETTDYKGLPENVTGVDFSRLQSVDPRFSSGQIQSSLDFSGLPGLETGGIQRGVAGAGPIQRSVNTSGQWDYNDVGGPDRRLNIQDPTTFTKGVNDTLYGAAASRFEPEITQHREELRQSLADRGIPEDSEAGQRELNRFDQNASDTRLQASASATDRAAAQAAQLFGLDLSKFGAENAAQDQAFQQTAVQRGDILNTGLSTGRFANDAQAQQYGQNLSSANFANSAQNQGFGQSLAGRQQMADELLKQGQFGNEAQQQGFTQDAARQQLALQLRQQGLSEQEINAALAAQARQAGYTERENVRMQPINDTMRLLGG